MRAAFENEAKPEQQGSSSDVCRCAGWERHHPFCLSDGQAEPVSIWSSICVVVQSQPQQGSGPNPRETNTVVFYQVSEKSTRLLRLVVCLFCCIRTSLQLYPVKPSSAASQHRTHLFVCGFFFFLPVNQSGSFWKLKLSCSVIVKTEWACSSQPHRRQMSCADVFWGSSLTLLYENADLFFSKWRNLSWKRGPGCARCQARKCVGGI